MSWIEQARQAADAATPGPWTWQGEPPFASVYAHDHMPSWVVADVRDGADEGNTDAAFIAMFDPQTVSALLDIAEAAEHTATFAAKGQGRTPVLTQQIVAELEAALDRFRTLMEGDR
jgi:hypothetical protein